MATTSQIVFTCLSSDAKPTTLPGSGADIPVASALVEADTGARFFWDGGQWVKLAAVAAAVDSVSQMLLSTAIGIKLELTALRVGMILAETCKEVQMSDIGNNNEPVYT